MIEEGDEVICMIKEGDEVICIKDYENSSSRQIEFNKEKSYKVYKFDPQDDTIFIKIKDENKYGFWFELNISDTPTFKYFFDYFITLAEWRQQQIDKILEDE